MVIKEKELAKWLYMTPLTEVVQVVSEGAMMKPSKWTGGDGTIINIHEGDYDFGDDDDGKGAKGNLWDDGSNNGMWDD